MPDSADPVARAGPSRPARRRGACSTSSSRSCWLPIPDETRADRLRRPVDRPAARAQRQRRRTDGNVDDDATMAPTTTAHRPTSRAGDRRRSQPVAATLESGRQPRRRRDRRGRPHGHRDRRRRPARRGVPRRAGELDALREMHADDDDSTGGRSTIIIGNDLDASGAFERCRHVSTRIDGPAGACPTDRRQRAEGRKRLIWVGAIGAGRSLLGARRRAGGVRLVAVRRATGRRAGRRVHRSDRRFSAAVVDDLHGRADPARRHPGRPSASSRRSPGSSERSSPPISRTGVLIDIRERQAAGDVRRAPTARFRVIDRDGRVLDVVDGHADRLHAASPGPTPTPSRGQFAGRPVRRGGADGQRPAASRDHGPRRRQHR